MNVLLVTPYYAPQVGGVSTYVAGLEQSLAGEGHQVFVLRLGSSHGIVPYSASGKPRVFELYLRSLWSAERPARAAVGFLANFIPTLVRLARFLRNRQIDVVSLEYPLACMAYFAVVKWWMRIKLLVGVHGSDLHLLHKAPEHEQQVLRWLFRRADWVLAHSAHMLSDAQRILGRRYANSSHLPCWVDVTQLRHTAALAPKPPLPAPYILTVAKLYPRKGLDILIQAVHQLSATTAIRFVIAGDGPEQERLQSLAAQLGVQERIVFLGDVGSDQIPALMQHCEFFVLPSRSEPFGIVLLEAMTFGKAVVATNVGGIPEFVKHGINGLLTGPEDSATLAHHIERLINDHPLRQTLGANGKQTVETEYDHKVLSKRYEQLYRMVCQ